MLSRNQTYKFHVTTFASVFVDKNFVIIIIIYHAAQFLLLLQVKEVFDAIASPLGLHVGLAVGQSSIADEISRLVNIPGYEAGMCYDPEDISLRFQLGFQSKVDILVATPGRLMDHINATKGFTLEHLYYLVSSGYLISSHSCMLLLDLFFIFFISEMDLLDDKKEYE